MVPDQPVNLPALYTYEREAERAQYCKQERARYTNQAFLNRKQTGYSHTEDVAGDRSCHGKLSTSVTGVLHSLGHVK